jgi:integrase
MEQRGYRLARYRGGWAIYWREKDPKTGRPVSRRRALGGDREAAERAFHDAVRLTTVPQDSVSSVWTAWKREKGEKIAARAVASEKHLLRFFGNLRPDQINRDICRTYIAMRRKAGAKDGTILREMGQLRASVLWQNRRSPSTWEMPPAPPPKNLHMTPEEYRRLLAEAKSPHVELFLRLALHTAGRKAALLDLTWDRVDFERGLITLPNGLQGGKGRAIVPMGQSLRTALTTAYENRTCDYVIEYGGRKVGNIRKAIEHAVDQAGLDGVTPHVLRHTAAVWMAEGGVPMAVIAQYLGHRDDRITQRVYARYSPDYLACCTKAIEKMEKRA